MRISGYCLQWKVQSAHVKWQRSLVEKAGSVRIKRTTNKWQKLLDSSEALRNNSRKKSFSFKDEWSSLFFFPSTPYEQNRYCIQLTANQHKSCHFTTNIIFNDLNVSTGIICHSLGCPPGKNSTLSTTEKYEQDRIVIGSVFSVFLWRVRTIK